jgi:hypothetical protein
VNIELTNGLPPKPSFINGYFFASQYYDFTLHTRCFASLSDPASDLTRGFDKITTRSFCNEGSRGNIDGGAIVYIDETLKKTKGAGCLNYSVTTSISNSQAKWSMAGNGSFSGFTVELSRHFPTLVYPLSNFSVSASRDIVLNMKEIAGDYDSVNVLIRNAEDVRRGVKFPESVIRIRWDELMTQAPAFPGSVFEMTVSVSNYSHRVLNDKVYLFELNSRNSAYLLITP